MFVIVTLTFVLLQKASILLYVSLYKVVPF